MESQKIKNLLDHKDEIYSRYQTKEWYVINDRNNGNYPEGDGNYKSSVKWTVLAHLKSQPRGQNFQTQI